MTDFLVRLPERSVAALILTYPLTLLGEWLVTHTHHRPLGAATFTTFAVVSLASGSLLAARFLGPTRTSRLTGAPLLGLAFGLASTIATLVRVVVG